MWFESAGELTEVGNRGVIVIRGDHQVWFMKPLLNLKILSRNVD
jgi:hypothetical protein